MSTLSTAAPIGVGRPLSLLFLFLTDRSLAAAESAARGKQDEEHGPNKVWPSKRTDERTVRHCLCFCWCCLCATQFATEPASNLTESCRGDECEDGPTGAADGRKRRGLQLERARKCRPFSPKKRSRTSCTMVAFGWRKSISQQPVGRNASRARGATEVLVANESTRALLIMHHHHVGPHFSAPRWRRFQLVRLVGVKGWV